MLASPASSMASASSVNGRLTRLTMKPGASSATTGVLPQRSISATARFTESPSVCGPRTTSTSGISGAGLKKWSPSTCSGRLVATAIAATDNALVFVARSASGGASRSSAPKIVRLRSRSSMAASMAMSAAAATASSVTAVRRFASRPSTHSSIESASSSSFAARRPRPTRTRSTPVSSACSSTS